MLKRIITAAVALAILFPVLYFSETAVFPLAIAVLAVIAVYELYRCIGFLGCPVLLLTSAAAAAAFPVCARYSPWLIPALTVVFACVALGVSVFGFKKFPVDKIGFATFYSLIIIIAFSMLVLVRDRQPQLYLLIFVAAWATDTMAYFAGRLFGKRHIAPDISPKKTLAGCIGGIIGCIAGFVVFGAVCNGCFGGSYPLWLLAVAAIPLSAVGQIGDLSASAVKRHYGIKDYGNLFPGHGGVLDRFDSILPITLLAFAITEIM